MSDSYSYEARKAAAAEIMRAADCDTEPEMGFDYQRFEADGQEWLILTDAEADAAVAEYVRETVWAFNTNFLLSHAREGVTEEALKAIQGLYEDGNAAILALIEDVDDLAQDAVASDGRGHFLAGWDGVEHEASIGGTWWFGYRQG